MRKQHHPHHASRMIAVILIIFVGLRVARAVLRATLRMQETVSMTLLLCLSSRAHTLVGEQSRQGQITE